VVFIKTVGKMESLLKKLVVILVLNYVSVSAENICPKRSNTPTENLQELHFTKETVDRDYAIRGDRKWLHCCARGYRTIEW
jgi:hypothetical protein